MKNILKSKNEVIFQLYLEKYYIEDERINIYTFKGKIQKAKMEWFEEIEEYLQSKWRLEELLKDIHLQPYLLQRWHKINMEHLKIWETRLENQYDSIEFKYC